MYERLCANRGVTPPSNTCNVLESQARSLFYKNVSKQMERMRNSLSELGLPAMRDTYQQWRWRDIADALLAGCWRQVVVYVDEDLKDYNIKGMYHSLESPQRTSIQPHRVSMFAKGASARYPAYAIRSRLQDIYQGSEDTFAQRFTEVPKELVEKWTNQHGDVVQTIGVEQSVYEAWKKLHVRYSCLTTVETDRRKFTAGLKERAKSRYNQLYCEFQVRGRRVEVNDEMRRIARNIISVKKSLKTSSSGIRFGGVR